jgi:uncharacterized protein (DUF983 family)
MMAMTQPAQRDMATAFKRGVLGRCPNCGKGKLFRAYLKVADNCNACGEEFHHQQADDAPAYFVIMLVGHIVVPIVLAVEIAFMPPYWLHALIFIPLTIMLAVLFLQPVKGAIIGWQWAQGMHGFGAHRDDSDVTKPQATTPKR